MHLTDEQRREAGCIGGRDVIVIVKRGTKQQRRRGTVVPLRSCARTVSGLDVLPERAAPTEQEQQKERDMTVRMRRWPAAVAAAMVFAAVSARAQGTAADYARALELRDRWMYLTTNLAESASWVGDTQRFSYRKTVRGGFQFVVVDATTLDKRAAFDHEKLAAALSKETGETYTALRLPFDDFRFSPDERSIDVGFTGRFLSCRLTDYVCTPRQSPRGGGRQPRSFGAVRDLEVPADNRPKRSPDGAWDAFVQNHNIVVRAAGKRTVTILSTDGSEGNFYDSDRSSGRPTRRRSRRTA